MKCEVRGCKKLAKYKVVRISRIDCSLEHGETIFICDRHFTIGALVLLEKKEMI